MDAIYVCLFNNSHIKVGRARDFAQRLKQHADRVSCVGVEPVESAVFFCKGDVAAIERELIERCAQAAENRSCNEWFIGLSFNAVCSFARELAATPHPKARPERKQHQDAELIERHGEAHLARLLNTSVQRVHNWKTRGIPSLVRLEHPELFPRA